MRTIAVADVGGTHARFALAEIEDGRVLSLDEPVTLKTAEHASFQLAWQEFGRRKQIDLPNELALAFAGPIGGEVLKLTNNPWVIRPSLIKERLDVDRYVVVNDFGAVGLRRRNSARRPIPPHLWPRQAAARRRRDQHRRARHRPRSCFAAAQAGPLRSHRDRGRPRRLRAARQPRGPHLTELRRNFRRVSVERIASGRGLWNLYEALGAIDGRDLTFHDDKQLWAAALDGSDGLALAALDRLCLTLGAVAGDMALAQGAAGVVIAGGVGLRIADYLPQSGFRDRFIAKGRFERRMDEMPVRLITHPQPGLFGAAAAFARDYR